MGSDLIEATKIYWRKLDELEAAYRRRELSTHEVNVRVEALMAELGQSRREALRSAWASLRHTVQQYADVIVGSVCVLALAYFWINTL